MSVMWCPECGLVTEQHGDWHWSPNAKANWDGEYTPESRCRITPIDLVAVYEKRRLEQEEAQRIIEMPKDGYAFASACAAFVSRLALEAEA